MILTQQQLHDALVERHGAEIQKKLDGATVGIAGLGGLGSNLAVFLARLGIGHMILVDFDVVDITNLNRQHYTMKDLGVPKTLALVEQLEAINPYLNYETYTERVIPANVKRLFSECDVIVEAFDKPDQKAMLIENVLTQLPDKPLGKALRSFVPVRRRKERRGGRPRTDGAARCGLLGARGHDGAAPAHRRDGSIEKTAPKGGRVSKILFFVLRQVGGAVCALDGCDRDFGAAERAPLRGRCGGRFGLLSDGEQLVDRLEQAEQHERHDEEVDDRGQKCAVAELDAAETEHKTAQIRAAGKTENRVDEVFGQRSHNAGERTADDNTDRHVHHVAAQREGFEFFDKLFHFYVPPSYLYYQFIRFP